MERWRPKTLGSPIGTIWKKLKQFKLLPAEQAIMPLLLPDIGFNKSLKYIVLLKLPANIVIEKALLFPMVYLLQFRNLEKQQIPLRRSNSHKHKAIPKPLQFVMFQKAL